MAEYININKIIDSQTEIITYEFSENITVEDCTKQLLDVFQEEIDAIKDDIGNKENKIRVNIKKSCFDVKLEAFRIALNDDNLIDPLFISNIMTFVKNSNSYEGFWEREDVFFNDFEEYTDLKLLLKEEIKKFCTKLCIYFVSIFKYYHKTLSATIDIAVELPMMYKAIMLSYDMMTILMAFPKATDFNTADCLYIRDSASLLNEMLSKYAISYNMLDEFLKEITVDEKETTKVEK